VAKIFNIRGSAIRVTDTSTGEILINEPTKDVWYKENRLQSGVIELYDCNDHRRKKSFAEVQLSEAIDENSIAFTESTFRDFVFQYLGFERSISVDNFLTDTLNLAGGFIVSNPCYGYA